MRYYRFGPGAGLGALVFAALIIFALIFVPARLAGEAFERLGLTTVQGVAVLAAMLIWRTASLTVFRSRKLVPDRPAETMQQMLLRMQGVEHEGEHTGELVRQRISLGVGGALVPLGLCAWFAAGLPADQEAWAFVAGGVAVVGAACFAALKPRVGRSPELPVWLPPLVTIVAALLVSGREYAPQATYLSAVLGTLAGTGVLPFVVRRTRRQLDAPNIVIGGPGVFGGIFLATLAAGLFS